MLTYSIPDIVIGYKKVIHYLITEKNFQLETTIPLNKNRYLIAKGNNENYLILFKRDYYNSFSKKFNLKNYELGDSINCQNLSKAISENCKRIYILFSDTKLFTISIKEFLEKSEDYRWTNKMNKLVRSISINDYTFVRRLE